MIDLHEKSVNSKKLFVRTKIFFSYGYATRRAWVVRSDILQATRFAASDVFVDVVHLVAVRTIFAFHSFSLSCSSEPCSMSFSYTTHFCAVWSSGHKSTKGICRFILLMSQLSSPKNERVICST